MLIFALRFSTLMKRPVLSNGKAVLLQLKNECADIKISSYVVTTINDNIDLRFSCHCTAIQIGLNSR